MPEGAGTDSASRREQDLAEMPTWSGILSELLNPRTPSGHTDYDGVRRKCIAMAVAILALASLLAPMAALAQQVADTSFDVSVARPTYPRGTGPVVAIDEAHHNFHTLTGRYAPFARLLENDGYRLVANTAAFSPESLARYQVLVIANAIGGEWNAEAFGRAGFTDAEADALEAWVGQGGLLLLIADHAPMGVAAEILGRKFGVGMSKGFTEDPEHFFQEFGGPSILLFTRENGLLREHPVTRGRDAGERINRVVAFTGQSLAGPPEAEVVLALGDRAFDHPSPTVEQVRAQGHPGTAWRTAIAGLATTSARGRAVALALPHGRGRVFVLGEAGMLSAQAVRNQAGELVGIMGMNVPGLDNKQLALNILHWLTGVLP